ncbi:hypothetical protein [Parvularcula bermudensis]|nr:hypothetical protein [Parvularcula bermudensis]
MDGMSWTLILAAMAALFIAAQVMKAALGLIVRFALYGFMAVVIHMRQTGEQMRDIDIDQATLLLTAAGVAFVATGAIVLLLFRNTRWRYLLSPLLGFGLTFAAVAAVG